MQKLIVKLSLLAVLGLIVAIAALGWFALRPLDLKTELVDFTVERGASMRGAARVIRQAGVEIQPEMLAVLARLTGKANSIKAGSYEVTRGVTAWQLLLKLTAGDVTQREFRIIEGWTFRQVLAALQAHPDLRHDAAGLSSAEILQRIGASESNPEGLFFPDTYLFDRQSSELAVLRRAYQEMQRLVDTAWAGRGANLPLKSPYEALILASIIEKETGREDDRALVGSVFINRLRIGMRLQTDPTVIYGLGESFEGSAHETEKIVRYALSCQPSTMIDMPSSATPAPVQSSADSFTPSTTRSQTSAVAT